MRQRTVGSARLTKIAPPRDGRRGQRVFLFVLKRTNRCRMYGNARNARPGWNKVRLRPLRIDRHQENPDHATPASRPCRNLRPCRRLRAEPAAGCARESHDRRENDGQRRGTGEPWGEKQPHQGHKATEETGGYSRPQASSVNPRASPGHVARSLPGWRPDAWPQAGEIISFEGTLSTSGRPTNSSAATSSAIRRCP